VQVSQAGERAGELDVVLLIRNTAGTQEFQLSLPVPVCKMSRASEPHCF
jgi:hypothetical protein